jgi:hypothetical protein
VVMVALVFRGAGSVSVDALVAERISV